MKQNNNDVTEKIGEAICKNEGKKRYSRMTMAKVNLVVIIILLTLLYVHSR